jgi:hypothetical protein
MNSPIDYSQQFVRADTNHDGTIDEREFRQFLGPVINERRLSGSAADMQTFVSFFFILFFFI